MGSIGSHRLFWLIVELLMHMIHLNDLMLLTLTKFAEKGRKKEKHYTMVLTKQWKVYISMVEKTDFVKGNRYHPALETEEHIVLIKEPGSEYLGYVKTSQGSSQSIKIALYHF